MSESETWKKALEEEIKNELDEDISEEWKDYGAKELADEEWPDNE